MPPPYDAPHYIDEALALLSSLKDSPPQDSNIAHEATELAALMMRSANLLLERNEKRRMKTLKKEMESQNTKAFIFESMDLLSRIKNNSRAAREIPKIISRYGIPEDFSPLNKFLFFVSSLLSKKFPDFVMDLTKKRIIKNFSYIIRSGNSVLFEKFLKEKQEGKSSYNIVHLKEDSIGEKDVKEQEKTYINYLSNPNIEYISIKVSTISSKIKVNSPESSVQNIIDHLRKIFKAAKDFSPSPKFVNIDMESYKYFRPTIAAFKKILEEEEFKNFYAGITLQSYLPNSFPILKTLIKWAMNRTASEGAPIKISIVKGAYLSKEQVVASEKGWPQAPYLDKISTDSNFKRMIDYALSEERIKSAHICICTHNIFDIAYSLILKTIRNVDPFVEFQMFDGRTPHIRIVLEKILKNPIRLYIPIFNEENFPDAVYFIQRRLEECAGSENFLRNVADLSPGNDLWENMNSSFINSIEKIPSLSSSARRSFGKKSVPISASFYGAFENEADTDFTLPSKIVWQEKVLKKGENFAQIKIPCVISGKEVFTQNMKTNFSPSSAAKPIYTYSLASEEDVKLAIKTAKDKESFWKNIPLEERRKIIAKTSSFYRSEKALFIEIMMVDSAKTFAMADSEISEAIDIIEYYQTRISKIIKMSDLEISPKGTIFIASARAFPYCSPLGGIIAALITGNCVLFKPPPNTVLTAWHLVNTLWDAGVPKEVLQFITCSDEITENILLKDERISSVILSGKAETAEKFIQTNPLLDLSTASEGKNTMIITALSDRSLAIKNLVTSAFSFSGQQYSCVSLAVLEEEVYNDPIFRKNLVDAASNLKVGSIWSPETDVGPLMHLPEPLLLNELTSLHGEEKWLLKPIQDQKNPLLFSPGIKLGITRSSAIYNNFLPGPILGLMKAKDFSHALKIANGTKYGLCASLQSLDEEEYIKWKNSIEAGNLYVNHFTTKTITRRNPFGGCKKSSYGIGFKSGGPNYLLRCINIKQQSLPQEKKTVNEKVNALTPFLEKIKLSAEELGLWYASIANYSYWWQRLKTFRDPAKIVGQDNFFGYSPLNFISVRVTENSNPLDILRICAGCLTCKTPFELSFDSFDANGLDWNYLNFLFKVVEESEENFIKRILENDIKKVRLSTKASDKMKMALAPSFCFINDQTVLANGRIELLNYIREISICKNYHRYGNLGTRESELRKPPV